MGRCREVKTGGKREVHARYTGDTREIHLEQALLRRAHRSAQVRAAAAEKQRRREAAERRWSPAAA